MFRLLLRNISYRCITTANLEKHIGPHIHKIITTNPHKYTRCADYMRRTVQEHQETQADALKKRLNLYFAVSNIDPVLAPYADTFYELIYNKSLTHQSELDRLVNWLQAEIKHDNSITPSDIITRLQKDKDPRQQVRQQQQLVSDLNSVKEAKKCSVDIGQLSKSMREKYPCLNSKLIYDKIKQVFQTPSGQINQEPESKEQKPFWQKLSSLKARLLPYETNTPQMTAKHREITQCRLRFRFPPEPNGYLHIGHCKSIRVNFQAALRLGGECYLRFDDTNPETQSKEYIQSIIDDVRWMGYEPHKITYASDYFSQIEMFAMELIKQGKAYVCESTREEMFEERKNKQSNPFRMKPIEFSLERFPNLKPNQTVRLKLDPASSNPTLRDPVIYRYKDHAHPRLGSGIKIFPTYDFTHCISDSLENIDYSLCSLEFEIRRELYYKILDMLNLYKPIVWEYSRLNISGNILSKRKITKLVEKKAVEGWDDPRLLTISGLRNRGYTRSMIASFIDKVNVSRAGNENVIQHNVLTIQLKKELNKTAERTMSVLDPHSLKIVNLESPISLSVPLFPESPQKGRREMTLHSQVFIQKGQKIEVGQVYRLRYVKQPVKILSKESLDTDRPFWKGQLIFKTQSSGEQSGKPNGKIPILHWISQTESYSEKLFISDPNSKSEETQPVFNEQNTIQYRSARIPRNLNKSKVYQFERLGYYKFHNSRLICISRI